MIGKFSEVLNYNRLFLEHKWIEHISAKLLTFSTFWLFQTNSNVIPLVHMLFCTRGITLRIALPIINLQERNAGWRKVRRSLIHFVTERWREWVNNISNVINRREEIHELMRRTLGRQLQLLSDNFMRMFGHFLGILFKRCSSKPGAATLRPLPTKNHISVYWADGIQFNEVPWFQFLRTVCVNNFEVRQLQQEGSLQARLIGKALRACCSRNRFVHFVIIIAKHHHAFYSYMYLNCWS